MNRARVIVGLLGAFLLSACAELLEISAHTAFPEILFSDSGQNLSGSPDKVVTAGDTVVLEPVVADDIDLSAIDYEWRQIKGPSVRIEILANGNARFVAPDVEAMDEVIFRLRAMVDDEPIQEDSYVIYVGANHP